MQRAWTSSSPAPPTGSRSAPSDAKSGARFERLVIDGEPHFLKSLSAADDWIMRVTGNTSNWEFKVWQAGLYAQTPAVIDHTVLGMALEGDRPLRS